MGVHRLQLVVCMLLVLACGCRPGPLPVTGVDPGPRVQQMRIVDFPVGRSIVLERKVVLGNAISVVPGVWSVVGAITIPAHGYYLVTLQVRMPRGAWAEARMVRVGWGHDADGRDETGYHTFQARPDGLATSESFTHALSGGGPLAFEINLHPKLRKGRTGPMGPVQLHTVVCKAHRSS